MLTAATAAVSGIGIGLLPVLVFLSALVSLESFKLVPRRLVALLLLGGALAGVAGLLINQQISAAFDLNAKTLVRYVAPGVEELLKGLFVIYLIARNRVGFLVDSAICGFAVGAGFAAVENVYYFSQLEDATILVWIVRGFGTAIMHGGVVSLMAVISKLMTERQGSNRLHLFLPGLVLAAGLHTFFNHFYLSPSLSTLIILTLLPVLFVLVFRVSGRATQEWLGVGFDTDQELLTAIREGRVSEGRIGSYLSDLRTHFAPEIVVDMLCLIRLHLELSIRAKGILIMRKEGFEAPLDEEFTTRLEELRYLEKSLGKTGLMALEPIFSMSSRDLWKLEMIRRQ